MLFKDKLYHITDVQITEDNSAFKIDINANHDIFRGHFPSNPVTPGVVQIEMVKELLSIIHKSKVSINKIANCKFLTILNPEKNSKVSVSIDTKDVDADSRNVSAIIFYDDHKFLKMSATYSFTD